MSKTYSVTGWRVGTILAPPVLTHAFRQVHDFVSIGAAAPLQEAGAVAYRLPRSYYDALTAEYQARRDLFCPALQEIGFGLEMPQGAYYIMADISAFGATDDVEFARHLVREVGVAVVPGSSFFRDQDLGRQYVRFCFCKRTATLEDALGRLKTLRHN
jgi:aminotransferase